MVEEKCVGWVGTGVTAFIGNHHLLQVDAGYIQENSGKRFCPQLGWNKSPTPQSAVLVGFFGLGAWGGGREPRFSHKLGKCSTTEALRLTFFIN